MSTSLCHSGKWIPDPWTWKLPLLYWPTITVCFQLCLCDRLEKTSKRNEILPSMIKSGCSSVVMSCSLCCRTVGLAVTLRQNIFWVLSGLGDLPGCPSFAGMDIHLGFNWYYPFLMRTLWWVARWFRWFIVFAQLYLVLYDVGEQRSRCDSVEAVL